ncbi:nucleotidyltransferase family protein [Natronincola ferrireducens]|uniref:Polymerase nucleotidyl transferase domain-containing protein n=1 Tax=Natronincola ferrireducens TaxID=393762 RepID=A0A1G8YBP2_9FIRM|nr:nucleotidyltransferase family protein [Natronincola ferrireducens]SDK00116.1 hypothetical protein SAMN05660472_00489 [Natronincola ferrireducens]
MKLIRVINDHKKQINSIADKYGVVSIKVFGSVARGEEKSDSDIDLLVKLEEGRSLFDLIGFKNDLEYLLKRKVDVVTEESLHWTLKDQVSNEVVEI